MRIYLATLLFLCGAFAANASAQIDSAPNKTEKPNNAKKSQSADQIEKIHLAYQLAKYGRAAKSPDAMIVAAKILLELPAKKMEIEKQTEGGEDDFSTKKDAGDATAAQFLRDARLFARGDKNILARIREIEKTTSDDRGAYGGPKRSQTRVRAKATDVFPISFRGGEQAVVSVSGDGDTDLDLFVFDQKGNLIASATDGTDDCIVRFYPLNSGLFIIRVKNLGSVYNRYVLATN